jgi:hypothetical protein
MKNSPPVLIYIHVLLFDVLFLAGIVGCTFVHLIADSNF